MENSRGIRDRFTGTAMKTASKHPALAVRIYRANRIQGMLQATLITAVALGATVMVGVTSFTV